MDDRTLCILCGFPTNVVVCRACRIERRRDLLLVRATRCRPWLPPVELVKRADMAAGYIAAHSLPIEPQPPSPPTPQPVVVAAEPRYITNYANPPEPDRLSSEIFRKDALPLYSGRGSTRVSLGLEDSAWPSDPPTHAVSCRLIPTLIQLERDQVWDLLHDEPMRAWRRKRTKRDV